MAEQELDLVRRRGREHPVAFREIERDRLLADDMLARLGGGGIEPAAVAAAITHALTRFDLDESETTVALALKWEGEPSHSRLRALAEGLGRGFPRTVAAGRPLILIMEGDVARLIGRLLRTELGVTGDIVSLDGIQLREFDDVDIGELVQPADVIPLIIKSLLFTPGHASE